MLSSTTSFFFRSFGRCEPLLGALCSAKPGYHWTGKNAMAGTPKNDGNWLEDDVSLTKKHSDFLLVPNGFLGFLGFVLSLRSCCISKAFLSRKHLAFLIHQFGSSLWTQFKVLRFTMSPTSQTSHPRCLQEPQDGPEVHALNRLLAKVVETEAGFLLIHGRLAAIS